MRLNRVRRLLAREPSPKMQKGKALRGHGRDRSAGRLRAHGRGLSGMENFGAGKDTGAEPAGTNRCGSLREAVHASAVTHPRRFACAGRDSKGWTVQRLPGPARDADARMRCSLPVVTEVLH